MARQLGIHVETLRYYEGLGLLPIPARTAGGRRVYSEESLQLLRSIRLAKSLGLRLSEIRALLPGEGRQLLPTQVLAALTRAQNRTRDELDTLKARQRNLQTLASVVRKLSPEADLRTELRDAWVRLEQAGGARSRRPNHRARPSSG